MSRGKETKRVRILNESGMGFQTKVTNMETGEEIPNVASISLTIQPSHFIHAEIQTHAPAVDVIADAEISRCCPYCKREWPEEELQ